MIGTIGLGFAISALLISLTDLAFTVMDRRTGKPQDRIFLAILLILIVNAACEIVTAVYEGTPAATAQRFLSFRVAKYLYFVTHTLLPPAFYAYVSFVAGRSVDGGLFFGHKKTPRHLLLHRILIGAVVLVELLILCNPVTHWTWSFDADGSFRREWGEYVYIYLPSVLWIIASFILVMRSWNILSKNRKQAISVCFVMVLVGIGIQMIFPTARIEVLLETLGFTGVLLFIENDDDLRNVTLDIYNASTFTMDLNAALYYKTPLHAVIVRDICIDRKNDMIAPERVHRSVMRRAIADYLATLVPRHHIYDLGHGRFAVKVFGGDDAKAHDLAETILSRFNDPWEIDGDTVGLDARIMVIAIPERAASAHDVRYIAECQIPPDVEKPLLEGSDLDWIVRHAAVEEAVSHGIEKGSFEVYYQPTYNIDRTLHGAEALLRMHDETLGSIYPDEFIPVAEQLGLIDSLDDLVLREVCRFLATGIPQRFGMDCINVNLSVLECMKEGFAEHVSGIVEDAGIRKRFINFEITESVAANDYRHLANVIDRLRQQGFLFSIDDYGTGYSNMTSLFSLGADIIKIDKSLLWNAEKSELGMTLLKTSIDMVHDMKKLALMEGVETEEQLAVLERLHCDYLQGYFFAKPLTQEQLIALLEGQTVTAQA